MKSVCRTLYLFPFSYPIALRLLPTTLPSFDPIVTIYLDNLDPIVYPYANVILFWASRG